MIRKVLSFISQKHMIKLGDHIVAAVSGGADSVCLLHILASVRLELGFKLTAVHVEHGIRGVESEQDAQFVKELCEKLGIPLRIYLCKAGEYAKDMGMSLEEGARELRYHYFARARKENGADKTAIAHNQNDCAETMLFHLARGTGLQGMCGIVPARENMIRPLLCVTREEIEGYLALQGQEYRTDTTNLETEYTRNKIRHQVLPVLEKINSQAVPHFYQGAEIISETVELMEELVSRANVLYVKGSFISEEIVEEPELIQRMLIHRLLSEYAGSSKDITSTHIYKVQGLLGKQVGKGLSLPYCMQAVRTYGGILIKKVKPGGKGEGSCQETYPLSPGKVIKISVPDEGTSNGENPIGTGKEWKIKSRIFEKDMELEKISKKRYTKWFDYDKIKGNVLIRSRRPGDYFVMDGQGKRKKLKDYFINEKFPVDERDKIWLVAEGAHVIWVIGGRISEAYKVTESTKRILELQFEGGRTHG